MKPVHDDIVLTKITISGKHLYQNTFTEQFMLQTDLSTKPRDKRVKETRDGNKARETRETMQHNSRRCTFQCRGLQTLAPLHCISSGQNLENKTYYETMV